MPVKLRKVVVPWKIIGLIAFAEFLAYGLLTFIDPTGFYLWDWEAVEASEKTEEPPAETEPPTEVTESGEEESEDK